MAHSYSNVVRRKAVVIGELSEIERELGNKMTHRRKTTRRRQKRRAILEKKKLEGS